MLVDADLVDKAQIAHALSLQPAYGERLASILVRQRMLTEKFAVSYLGRQLHVPHIDISREEIHLSLFDVVPVAVCERHLVVPVKIEDTRLLLAMANPLDQVLVAELEVKTNVRLLPAIALESSIKNAIIEARRALKVHRKTIRPNVQRTPPLPALDPGATRPRQPQTPISVVPAADLAAAYETVTGAPLDVTAGRHPPSPAPSKLATEPRPTAKTILVVEDDEEVLKLICGLLEADGHNLRRATTGRGALTSLRQAPPDLAVLDGMLPEVHGFEICRQLKSSERYRHIPVVIVSAVHTGWRFAADVKERYGADDYIEKPFSTADLRRRIQVLLQQAPQPAPKNGAARESLEEGLRALEHGRFDEAVETLQKGIGLDPLDDMLHYYLAMTYEKKDMAFHAIDHYERAVRLNPDFYDAITALANLYQRQEFWRKAVDMWELALRATADQAVRSRIKQHILTLL